MNQNADKVTDAERNQYAALFSTANKVTDAERNQYAALWVKSGTVTTGRMWGGGITTMRLTVTDPATIAQLSALLEKSAAEVGVKKWHQP